MQNLAMVSKRVVLEPQFSTFDQNHGIAAVFARLVKITAFWQPIKVKFGMEEHVECLQWRIN